MHREMKKLLLSLALLLCVGSSFGQTAEKLMEKYKAFPSAEYKEKTEEALKDIKEEGPGDMSQEDFDFIIKNFKKSEQVQLTLDEAQKEQLDKDLRALKGYEMIFTQNDNKAPEEERISCRTCSTRRSAPVTRFVHTPR